MKSSTKSLLDQAKSICDKEDRSTEYMIQFMQDFAGVDHECVMNYLCSHLDAAPDKSKDVDAI